MDFDDLTGKVFDKLSVIGYAGRSNSNKRMYKCLCSCGKEFVGEGSHIRTGKTTSCGCDQKEKRDRRAAEKVIGKVFGQLTVIEYVDTKNSDRRYPCIKRQISRNSVCRWKKQVFGNF